ncbi:UNVERIFIED_CONTAM: hypothetical protein FKN15_046125 [Acipenser sinensis]
MMADAEPAGILPLLVEAEAAPTALLQVVKAAGAPPLLAAKAAGAPPLLPLVVVLGAQVVLP